MHMHTLMRASGPIFSSAQLTGSNLYWTSPETTLDHVNTSPTSPCIMMPSLGVVHCRVRHCLANAHRPLRGLACLTSAWACAGT